MVGSSLVLALGTLAAAGITAAQFPPRPEGVTVLRSKLHENVTISYKEPGICEQEDMARSYAGYVHLPPGFLDDVNGEKQDYPVNTFFYFFEARVAPETAPLAIWLNGGPGGSSLIGLFQENGPCFINNDSQTTSFNPDSWNTYANMLYIDQPNQVGFSYDTPTNVTIDLPTSGMDEPVISPVHFSDGVPESNLTHLVGTISSQKPSQTANSTAQAAHALWHFAQIWFNEFPHHKPEDDRISLWTESYGGHYGPGFMRFFQEQNEKISNGTIPREHAHYLHLDTLGIINGFMDAAIQGSAYIEFPHNNTYGIEVFDKPLYDELMHNWTRPDGCRDQTLACERKLGAFDAASVNRGFVSVAEVCDMADWCEENVISAYIERDHGWFDIGHKAADPFPPSDMLGYLTQEHVLQALGSPVNYTFASGAVATGFGSTHDPVHGGFLDAIAYLLDSGVKVHLIYGDRDYACNWLGGERASLAVPYSRQKDFAESPYGLLWTPDGFSGITRQLGNYSFTRVFQAGHMVPAYQPIAAYELFKRATFGLDMGLGIFPVHDELRNDIGGESVDRWTPTDPPPVPEEHCYVLNPMSCSAKVWEKVAAGQVIVKDFYVVGLLDEEEEEEEVPVSKDGKQEYLGDDEL